MSLAKHWTHQCGKTNSRVIFAVQWFYFYPSTNRKCSNDSSIYSSLWNLFIFVYHSVISQSKWECNYVSAYFAEENIHLPDCAVSFNQWSCIVFFIITAVVFNIPYFSVRWWHTGHFLLSIVIFRCFIFLHRISLHFKDVSINLSIWIK